MKLTEGWGEPKNDSRGEHDGCKMEEGKEVPLPTPSSPLLP